jgi:UDP-3-O-[3-hydroxymyristoyl] glucosamine N-acyltransferase
VEITQVAPITEAGPGAITFLAQPKFKKYLATTQASAIIVAPQVQAPDRNLLVVPNPYLAYAQITDWMNPPKKHPLGVSPESFIGEGAGLGADLSIYPGVYVGSKARIGDRTVLMPGVFIGEETVLGEDCLIYPSVTIMDRCRLGNRVILHPGVVVGSDGYGYVPYEKGFYKIPQIGIVEIEDEVEVGANTTIDRAALGKTVIRRGVKIDNLVQVAHNVEVGEHTLLVAQVGIAGSAKIGKRVALGGQVGVAGHIEIGDEVMVAAKSGVARDIPPKQVISGIPAMPHPLWLRTRFLIEKLPQMAQRIKDLEEQIKSLQAESKGA